MLVRRYLAYLQERPSATGKPLDSHTVNGHIRIIRTLLFWAANEELIDENIPRRIKPPRKEKKVVRVLTAQQIDLLFEAAKRTSAPLRDTALLYLLLDTGCRASELCGLLVDNVIFESERAYIIVYGKGRKQRPIRLGKKARLALARYLHRERKAAESEPHVFMGERGPLSAEGLERLLYRLRDAAGDIPAPS
jgi:integrase/recombinase XerD